MQEERGPGSSVQKQAQAPGLHSVPELATLTLQQKEGYYWQERGNWCRKHDKADKRHDLRKRVRPHEQTATPGLQAIEQVITNKQGDGMCKTAST